MHVNVCHKQLAILVEKVTDCLNCVSLVADEAVQHCAKILHSHLFLPELNNMYSTKSWPSWFRKHWN